MLLQGDLHHHGQRRQQHGLRSCRNSGGRLTSRRWLTPSGSLTFSSPFFLLVYLILEVAAYQQNMGRTGFFWHIDSLHYDANFTLNGDRNNYCWRDAKSPSLLRPHGRFGDYHCDSSSDLIASALSFMKAKMGDKVDFIIWTGNSIPQSPNFPLSNMSARHEVLEKVTEMFHMTFPYTTVYPVLGNLDIPTGATQPQFFSHHQGTSTWRSSNSRRKSWRHHDEPGDGASGSSSSTSSSSSSLLSRRSTYGHVADLWQNWLPPTAVDTLKKGGYYNIELAGSRLRLIGLNMNLYLEEMAEETRLLHHSHRHNNNNKDLSAMAASSEIDPEEQWSWLFKVMEEAKKKGQHVILFGHSPPGKYERSGQLFSTAGERRRHEGQHWLQDKFNRKYLQFVRRYSDIIVGQFFGHQHTDTFRIFKDGAGKPISWALLNPSVSPFKISANGLLVESTNPSVRLYRYDSFTGEVFDYAQYYLDLTEANRKESEATSGEESVAGSASSNQFSSGNSPDLSSSFTSGFLPAQLGTNLWKLEYNFSTLYSLPDISVATLESLSRQLRTNRSWFDEYYRANMVGYEGPWLCSEECRQSHMCAIGNIDYADYHYCIENKGADLKTSFDLASSSTAAAAPESRIRPGAELKFVVLAGLLLMLGVQRQQQN